MSLKQEVLDEFLVVCSAFGDIVEQESSRTLLVKPNNDAEIRFTVSEDYPENAGPSIEVSGPSLSSKIKSELKQKLEDLSSSQLGQFLLYDLTNLVKEYFENLASESRLQDDQEKEEKIESEKEKSAKIKEKLVEVPEIYGTDILTDRKSVFQAHIGKITSKEQAMAMLNHLMENHKIARATHRIYAYRTFIEKDGRTLRIHDCEDDGEFGAGPKVLNLLELMEAENVMVIVTRWYGGIHLGPDRFRHILNMARKAIVESGFVNNAKVLAAKATN